jgi:formate C-acetyltransferase
MLSYYMDDIARGVSREELLELTELFFLSLNVDTDIYFGLQQGDNGQSIVLGGYDKHGNDMFNDLSRVCMDASLELKVIDPKVNLRVSKKTPDSLYEYGTKLTKQGLGFPQYCNDDIIVPYMMSLGYDEDDAYNYSVAACWEVISPDNGMDVPNKKTFDFPLVVNTAVHKHLCNSSTFEEFMANVKVEFKAEAQHIVDMFDIRLHPEQVRNYCQYLSLFVDGCIEKGADISSYVAKYNNFGCHGLGIANGADAVAAIKKLVYEDKTVKAEELVKALEDDFVGHEELRNALCACPKMGNNDNYVDDIASELMEYFVGAISGVPNGCGGIWRAGTGSAMGYVLHAREVGATADGRHAYDYYSSSFSPAITTQLNGPLSVIQSFTKYDLGKICNGGPLTMELHDTVFRNEEGERKVAQLVKAFVHLGGHQLQLNSINRDILVDAKEHPENHKNLIVRVWGWSGYFCELDVECQNHIIRRTEFTV